MSATLIVIICVVAVAALGAWLAAVMLSDRNPSWRHSRAETRRGRVQGGTHVGGGRSVAPRRDGEITPEDDPEDPTVAVHKRNTPMDL